RNAVDARPAVELLLRLRQAGTLALSFQAVEASSRIHEDEIRPAGLQAHGLQLAGGPRVPLLACRKIAPSPVGPGAPAQHGALLCAASALWGGSWVPCEGAHGAPPSGGGGAGLAYLPRLWYGSGCLVPNEHSGAPRGSTPWLTSPCWRQNWHRNRAVRAGN